MSISGFPDGVNDAPFFRVRHEGFPHRIALEVNGGGVRMLEFLKTMKITELELINL